MTSGLQSGALGVLLGVLGVLGVVGVLGVLGVLVWMWLWVSGCVGLDVAMGERVCWFGCGYG